MTDDEKKAMKYFYNLRATIDESNMLFDEDIEVKCGKETIKQITIILNLIEKQSKEIEELKMQLEVEKIDNKYNQEEASEEMIPRYRIRAKIEELKKYQDKFDELNMLKDVLIKQNEIQVLQSLLEKE